MRPRRATAAIVIALALGACGGGVEAPSDPEVVQVWFHAGQGSERDTLEAQVRAFNAATPDVQVDLALQPEGDYDRFVREAAEAGELPCLLDLDGPYLTPYVAAGYLRPLGDLLPRDVLDDLLPSLQAQGRIDDEVYGVGVFDSGLALWGNRAYLEAADVRIPTGIADAWTLDELGSVLAALSRLPQVEHAIDLKTNYDGEWFTYGFLPFVWDRGGDILVDGRAAGAMDSDETVDALSTLADWVEAGYVDPAAADDDSFRGTRTAALSWVGHWLYPAYRDALGDDLVLLPAPAGPAAQTTGMGSWQWGISAGCPTPEAAATFLGYLLEPDEVLRMTNANGAVPGRLAALERSPLYGPDGPLRLLAEQLTEGIARPRPVTPRYAEVSAAFSSAVQDVLAGADPRERLARAVAELEGS